ncbi:MAG: SirB2 family protein [Gammaproteobacteria bacterium]|nr:SirB2 family protein [Gammaproteobacteria bacterium]
MTIYNFCLYIHIASVVTSISLFIVRGYWMMTENALLNRKMVKILPHVIDTLLLVSAIALTLLIDQYPFAADWLTVKFFALIVYIVLGTIALKRGKTRATRCIALAAAVLTFLFITSVAWHHQPLGIFSQ